MPPGVFAGPFLWISTCLVVNACIFLLLQNYRWQNWRSKSTWQHRQHSESSWCLWRCHDTLWTASVSNKTAPWQGFTSFYAFSGSVHCRLSIFGQLTIKDWLTAVLANNSLMVLCHVVNYSMSKQEAQLSRDVPCQLKPCYMLHKCSLRCFWFDKYCIRRMICLQCFDAVSWAAGRASCL